MENIIIDCGDCIMRATTACSDCVVSFVCDAGEHEALVLDMAEHRAVRWFAEAGLVPTLRHRAAKTA